MLDAALRDALETLPFPDRHLPLFTAFRHGFNFRLYVSHFFHLGLTIVIEFRA